ncbi:eukaryotic translation initiation factor 3 subunit EifCa [Aspergillus tubingensis]|uniref:Uncharacterized protein n=1 Tax=Aspergillus niger TaxID=5061 RepID=A0A117DWF3_ASPNG|nr:eukaryotic translation initiation factor 3 subunit EifCa [Aspergillus tubingensis]GAQ36368.1 hypothetical protein ABL_01633 [Aspergillus niger]GFN14482.1 eukaryotic translation initiation factor 3 subunit EifCa [Aspergillus tubingensis]
MDHFDKQLREDRLAHLPPAMLPRQPPPLDQNGKMVVSRARVSIGLLLHDSIGQGQEWAFNANAMQCNATQNGDIGGQIDEIGGSSANRKP